VVSTLDGSLDFFETIEVVAAPDQLEVDLFPNPFEEKITLRLIANDFEPITVEIRDLKGRLVHQQSIIPNGRTSSHIMELKPLIPGMYFVVIRGQAYPIVKGL
jgi:hypothetical protein